MAQRNGRYEVYTYLCTVHEQNRMSARNIVGSLNVGSACIGSLCCECSMNDKSWTIVVVNKYT